MTKGKRESQKKAPSSQNKKELKSGFRRRLIEGLVIALLTLIIATLFSPFSKLYDELWVKHPDTHIYQPYLLSKGPLIMIRNDGNASDRLRIEIKLNDPNDEIKDIRLSENMTFTLLSGGSGNNYANFIIEELWPDTIQYVQVITSSHIKVAADIKGYSLFSGKLEEDIPVIQIK